MQQILIAGIDPGTTKAYAFLDGNGKPVNLNSSKKANLGFLLREATRNGEVIIVGTDKKKCPCLVKKFAAKLGTKVIKPEQDLTIKEKNELIRNFEVKNGHEADALAAAVYAHKKISSLFMKIDLALKKTGKEKLSSQVKKMVVKKRTNIKETLEKLEKTSC